MRHNNAHYTSTKLFDYLRQRGIRQDWLAAEVGCSKSYLSMMKAGQRRIPAWFAERAAAALGLPVDLLFFELNMSEDIDSETGVAA